MSDQSSMFPPTTSEATRKSISSPGSADGPTRSDSPDGPTTDQSGPDHVPVSRFRARASKKAMTTNDTSGPLFTNSSPSADLQRSLENRLRANLDVNGSPEYALTWKMHDMQSGPPICALRASGRRTSGKGFSGWPTPKEQNSRGPSIKRDGLWDVAQTAGWGTPQAHDHKVGVNTDFQTVAVQAFLCGEAPGSSAQTGKSDASRLNPAFSLWLMGYPIEWARCAVRVTRSSRKSPRPS